MKLIAVIPTYNERDNLPELLRRLFALGLDGFEVMIIDDNSPDGTGQLAEELSRNGAYAGKIEVIHRPGKMGLGTAYVLGFQQALREGAEYVLQMDADLSHPPEYIPAMLKAIEDCDVVIGSRYTKGGSTDTSWGLLRKALSRGANIYIHQLTGLKNRDNTGGFRCYKRRALEAIDLPTVRSQGFAFQIEVAYRCQRRGLKTLEIPIHFPKRVSGSSKLSWRIIREAMLQVWRIRGWSGE